MDNQPSGGSEELKPLEEWLSDNLTGGEEFDNGGKFWTDCMPSAHMDIEGFKQALEQRITSEKASAIQQFADGLVEKLMKFTAEHDKPMRDEAIATIQAAAKAVQEGE